MCISWFSEQHRTVTQNEIKSLTRARETTFEHFRQNNASYGKWGTPPPKNVHSVVLMIIRHRYTYQDSRALVEIVQMHHGLNREGNEGWRRAGRRSPTAPLRSSSILLQVTERFFLGILLLSDASDWIWHRVILRGTKGAVFFGSRGFFNAIGTAINWTVFFCCIFTFFRRVAVPGSSTV